MMVLVTYDVSTIKKAGQRRLRQVAKSCMRYGQRVQNSVFECIVTPAQFIELRAALLKIINAQEDSLRIYYLGDKYRSKIEVYGVSGVNISHNVLII